MFIILSIFVFALSTQTAYAQVGFPGPCPEVQLLTTFDLSQYIGLWFGHSRYPFAPAADTTCTFSYYKEQTGNKITIMNGDIRLNPYGPSNITGYGVVRGPGQLAAIFSKRQNPDQTNYIVLGTDYKNYAVVYNCKNVNATYHTKDAFIMGRIRNMPQETVAFAEAILTKNKIDVGYLKVNNQTNCENFPDKSLLP